MTNEILNNALKYSLLVLLALTVFSCGSEVGLEEDNSALLGEAVLAETKYVLYISSYSPAFFTFYEQQEGIRKRFEGQPVILDSEDMDTKIFNTPENLENFKRSLKYKLDNGKHYDAVIVGDDNGLVFLMDNKEDLFPETPIFFLGINNLATAVKSHEDPMVTGVVEAKSIGKTIELAYKIIPEATRVVATMDNTPSSQAEYVDLMSHIDEFPELEFTHINMSEMTHGEYFDEVAELGPTDILLSLSAVTDKDGNALTYEEMRHTMVKKVHVPIFSLTTHGVGDGLFGGCVISHIDQGYAAADMVMQYLQGTPVNEIPFSTESPNADYIDYQQFREFGFSLDNLPEDTILVDRTYTFWEQYGRVVLVGIIVIIIEFLIIFLLFSNIISRRNTESRLRSYIESAPDGIFTLDEKGILHNANKATCRITGYREEELVSRPLTSFLQEESMENTGINLKAITEEGHASGEVGYLTKSGEKRYLLLDIVTLDENEYLGFAKDITERKEALDKKEKLESQLQQSRKMDAIGQLAGGVAHDFNNILGGIMGAARILKSPGRNPDEESLRFLDIIIKSSKRAADLNSKLLAFSRKGTMAVSTVDMNDIVDDTLDILEQTIDRKIEISIDKEAKITLVMGDGAALQNSLLNLCINSSHAMPAGGVINITTRNVSLDEAYCENSLFNIEAGEFIDIEVRDTGSGISPKNMEKIFEPFFTTKEEGKGTGLGLAAVYGTVQDHKGAVTVNSELGTGTVFHMLFPCSASKKTVGKAQVSAVSGTGLVLLVDDEEFMRITGKYALEEWGYRVLLAENGEEAVDIFRERFEEIDLVIMDMIMPKMNGAEAFKLMKGIDPDCRVVISSGFTRDENLEELKAMGLVAFLQKPYKNNELSRQMAEVL